MASPIETVTTPAYPEQTRPSSWPGHPAHAQKQVDANKAKPLARDQAVERQHSPEELKRACQEFEAIFVRLILKEAHLDQIGPPEEDKPNLYGDLVLETLAKSVAQGGGLGLAEMLYRQISPELNLISSPEQNRQAVTEQPSNLSREK